MGTLKRMNRRPHQCRRGGKGFRSDAFAHCKFLAYSADAMPLFEKAGFAPDLDAGCIELGAEEDATRFVEMCRELRFWEREPKAKS